MKVGIKKDSALKVFGEDGPQRLDASHDLRRLCADAALGCVCARACAWPFYVFVVCVLPVIGLMDGWALTQAPTMSHTHTHTIP